MKTELPQVGQYALQQLFSRNSAGEIWRAYDSQQRRAVIIKFYRAGLSDAADELERYVQNVERVASLHHPNILPIYDVHALPPRSPGDVAPLICLARPYVQGKSLADYLRGTSAARKSPPSARSLSCLRPSLWPLILLTGMVSSTATSSPQISCSIRARTRQVASGRRCSPILVQPDSSQSVIARISRSISPRNRSGVLLPMSAAISTRWA